jgi:hypothetical protein
MTFCLHQWESLGTVYAAELGKNLKDWAGFFVFGEVLPKKTCHLSCDRRIGYKWYLPSSQPRTLKVHGSVYGYLKIIK